MAAYMFQVVFTLMLCFFQTGRCQDIAGPTQITISPTSLVMSPNVSDSTGGQVTVTCRPSSAGTEPLAAMYILRVLHTNPNAEPVALASARLTSNNGDAALELASLQAVASVSGNVSSKVITLTLNSAKCGDGGMYICTATTLGTTAKTYSNSANVSIRVSPDEIVMTAEPSGTTNWRVNDTLLMRCNGIVGTVTAESQIQWVWEYQDANLGFENWQSYSNIGNPDTDINNQGFTGSSNCYKYQMSELTRHLTLDDTGRQYRCYVINLDVSSQSADLAQVYHVGTVTEQGTMMTTDSWSNVTITHDNQATSSCPHVGAVIGAVVAVFVLIDVNMAADVSMLLRPFPNN